GMQDMGAAGIICSTSEMSAKGRHGMVIHLDKVPTRQKNMQAWEILLSESQERMLVVVKKGREAEVKKVFEKWDLNCVQIGEVTTGGQLKFHMDGQLVADVPADSLVLGGGAPVYEREYSVPSYFYESKRFNIDQVAEPSNLREVADFLLQHPNICSRRYVADQYDSMVGTVNMSTNAPSDAAIVNLKGTDKAIALTVDCNGRYVHADPEQGCAIAVAEAARNIVCSGGEPSAITNCLNFGNPYNKEVYWQFVNAIKGMGKACRKFKTPVTGGNVSFYNQSSDEGPVFPTPTIGMLGVLEKKSLHTTLDFKAPGDIIFLVGESANDIASSEYLYSWHGIKNSPAPKFDLDTELSVQHVVSKLIRSGLVRSAHDVSDGGLYITLLESSMPRGLGFSIETDFDCRPDAFLFGEAQSRIVLTVSPDNMDAFTEMLLAGDVEFSNLGVVNDGDIVIDEENWGSVADAKAVYDNALAKKLS
ncbi:MAG: AIR synthase-related protein, partial [Bacteroidota bacterium]